MILNYKDITTIKDFQSILNQCYRDDEELIVLIHEREIPKCMGEYKLLECFGEAMKSCHTFKVIKNNGEIKVLKSWKGEK
jgi:hypothetical protein